MKTLLITALALGISFVSSAFPNKLAERTAVRTSYEKVHVTLKEPMRKVRIYILNAEGDQLYKRTLTTKEPVSIPYDLSELPAGNYQVKIESEDEIAVYDVETREKKPLRKPLMAYGKLDDTNTITLLVVGLETPGVKVDLYNHRNKLLASEYITEPEGFSKNYKIVGKNADKMYFHLRDSQGRSKFVYPKRQQN